MNILVLGSTGRTGKLIVEEALKRGHRVTAIVRDPQNLQNSNLTVVVGTPYDYDTVEKALVGCDAVINALNVSRTSDNPWAPLRSPADLISRSAENAIKAMEKAGVNRFVALSTIGAGSSWKEAPVILKGIVSLSNLKYAFRDHGRQEELLKASPLDYTICRAPMLSDKVNSQNAVATPEGVRTPSPYLSRGVAASFFIQILESKEHLRETVNISNPH